MLEWDITHSNRSAGFHEFFYFEKQDSSGLPHYYELLIRDNSQARESRTPKTMAKAVLYSQK
jgi:hypothetical protein